MTAAARPLRREKGRSMRTRTDAAATSGHGAAGAAQRSRRGAGRSAGSGWRSHTFGDGTCSLTLTATLDVRTATWLRDRLPELCERGCDRLIVDVTSATAPQASAAALLGEALRRTPPGCEAVVVVPRGSALDLHLPARVAVAWSLTDARALLTALPAPSRAPAGGIGAADRHVLAIRQALRWTAQSAGRGDYEGALRGLATIERVEGTLPPGWAVRRAEWLAAARERTGFAP
jgi:hypothetical protein